jgi:hypothetical protein
MYRGRQKVIGISGRPVVPLTSHMKTLKPWHVEAIMLALQGYHADVIAEKFGVTAALVSNLLRTRQALEIRDRVNSQILKRAMDEVPDTVKQIQHAALANMQRVLTDEKLQKASPMALFDKSAKALEVMSRINPGTLSEAPQPVSQNTQVNNIFNIIEKEEQQTLHKQILESLSVAEVHSWVSGESIDGTGSVTTATRQLPNPETNGSGTEGTWAGHGSNQSSAKDKSEDGPVLSLDLGARVPGSQPESARKSLHMDAPDKDKPV